MLCVCVLRSIASWERFFENNRDKQPRQFRTNKPTSKEKTQNSMNKKWEKVAIERLKNVITSMGRVVNPWGTYPPTLGPKKGEISCYFLFLFHFNFEFFFVFFVFCFYFWNDVHSILKFVIGQLRKQTVRSRNITQQRTNLRSTQWRDDQQPPLAATMMQST